jgi:hypothetical protein
MSDDKPPLEQAVELFVYAPLGLVYEYKNVMPTLVRRGKSQVQIARFLGQMALKRQQGEVQGSVESVVGVAADLLAKGVTEFGQRVGLAPVDPPPESPVFSAEAGEAPASDTRLPIAGYETLRATDVIELLDDLDAAQRARIEAFERTHRNRKTVLAKLARYEN